MSSVSVCFFEQFQCLQSWIKVSELVWITVERHGSNFIPLHVHTQVCQLHELKRQKHGHLIWDVFLWRDGEMEAQLETVTAVRKKFLVWCFFKPQPLTRTHIGASEGIQFSRGVRVPVKTCFLPGCQDDARRLESLRLLPPPLEVPDATDVALWISEKPHGRTAWWEEQCLLWLWPLERYGELCRWLQYATRPCWESLARRQLFS